MTKISYISGIPQDEWADRGAKVPDQNFINYTALTEGELNLALLNEQLNILSNYYPEIKDFSAGKTMIDNALYKGIHGAPPAFGILSPELQKVAKAITKARKKTSAATGRYIFGRKSSKMGGVEDPLVPLNECWKILENVEPNDPNWGSAQAAYKACQDDNKYRPILNTHLEKSSHHLLYEFTKAQELSVYPTQVVVKATLHKAGTSTLHKVTNLSSENIRLWMRNGIMRTNAKKGTEPYQPEQTIQILAENAGEGIGVLPIAVIVAIITAIAAAATAAAQLISSIKSSNPADAYKFQEVQGIGTGAFGPENGDWYGYQPGGNGGGDQPATDEFSKMALPLAIGAGALLLLN